MKTPESVQLGVQSLGKVDANLPTAVANAEAQATGAFGDAIKAFGDVGMDIYKRDASAERNALATEYHLREAEMRAELESNPYEVMPDGSLRSRHTDLVGEYNEREKVLREDIMGRSQNGIATRQLDQDFELSYARSRTAVGATSVKWANDAAFANNEKAYVLSLQNFQWDEAKRITDEEAALGQITPGQHVEKVLQIDNHQTYNTYAQNIKNGGYVSPTISNQRSSGIEDRTNLSAQQKSQLHKQNFDNVVESQVHMLTTALEQGLPGYDLGGMSVTLDGRYTENVGEDSGGLTAGRLVIQQLRHLNPEDLGLQNEQELTDLVGKLNSVHSQYKLRMKQEQDDITAQQNCDKYTVPGAQPSKVTFSNAGLPGEGGEHGQDTKAINCAFYKRTDGLQKGTKAWAREGPLYEAKEFGFFSPGMLEEVNRSMINAGNRPEEAVAMVRMLKEAERYKGDILEQLKPEDYALVQEISSYTSAGGMLDGEAISAITVQIANVDKAVAKGRLNAWNAVADQRNVLETTLTGTWSDDDPWFAGLAISEDMVTDYTTLMHANVQIYENPETASRKSVSQLRNTWASTEVGGGSSFFAIGQDKRMVKNSPITVRDPEVDMTKKTKAFDKDFKELMTNNNLDFDTHSMGPYSPQALGGEGAWLVYDEDANPVVVGGEPLLWSPNYAETTDGKLEAFDAETARINADYTMVLEQSNTEERLAAHPGHRTQLRQAGEAVGSAVDATLETPRKFLSEKLYPWLFDPKTKAQIEEEAKALQTEIEYDQMLMQRAKDYDTKLRHEQDMKNDPSRYRYSRRSATMFNRAENRKRAKEREQLEQSGYLQ